MPSQSFSLITFLCADSMGLNLASDLQLHGLLHNAVGYIQRQNLLQCFK